MFSINCRGRLLKLDPPVVMGIINTTPDSFYKESRQEDIDNAIQKAAVMLNEGASILDIGGQSTRPGSERVSATEELQRVVPFVKAISAAFPEAILSIDTFYSVVAEAAVAAGASIVNDVSAGTIDPDLLPAVARLQVPYVLMHMQGDPQTMQVKPTYNNVVLDVFDQLNQQLARLTKQGIHDIIIDPGFGFGKTIPHNFELLHELAYFQQLGRPLMIGLSRKGTVYKTLHVTPEEALNGTTVLHTISLLQGAHILRVHDVREACQAIKLVQAYQKERSHS